MEYDLSKCSFYSIITQQQQTAKSTNKKCSCKDNVYVFVL